MISVDAEDYDILKGILKKYPLTIYAYGSRTKPNHKKFSDLDLCIFDDTYKKLDIFNLQSDLKESNLPFTVDILAWSMMSKDFQELIKNDLTLIQSNPALLDLEQNLLSRISYLCQKMKFKIVERSDCLIIDSNLNSSMFNVVYQKAIVSLPIKEVIDFYHGQTFAWLFVSHSWTNNMASALLENGFHKESQEYCMVLQLNTPFLFEVSYAIKVKNVKNLEDLKEFSSIIEQYDNRTSKIYHNKKIIKSEFVAKTLFFVAYVNQKAVGTGSLHFSDNNKAGIYDILVLEEYRGQGVASHMMKYLINYCQQRGIRQVSLSTSSKPGYRIYDKLGFKLVGKLECYEWAKN
jgi:ribosomal protein S18 acetylase RimI-like enzyme/predicted nucleotidyltransferase